MPNRIGVFLQLGTQFIRNDPRWLRLSDAAQGLWTTIEAIAMDERREFISPEWDADQLSWERHRKTTQIEDALEELQRGPRPLIYIMPDGRIRAVGIRKQHGERYLWREESKQAESWNQTFATGGITPLVPELFAAVAIGGRTGRPRQQSPDFPATSPPPETTCPDESPLKNGPTDVDVEVKAVQSKIQTRRSSTASTVKQPSCHTTAGLDKQSENHVNDNTWHVDPAIHQVADGLLTDWPSLGRDKVESQLRANLARGSPFHVLATVRDISLKFTGERKCAGKKIQHPWLALEGRFKKSEYSVSDTDLGWCKEQVEFTQNRGPPAQRGGEPESVGEILEGKGDG